MKTKLLSRPLSFRRLKYSKHVTDPRNATFGQHIFHSSWKKVYHEHLLDLGVILNVYHFKLRIPSWPQAWWEAPRCVVSRTAAAATPFRGSLPHYYDGHDAVRKSFFSSSSSSASMKTLLAAMAFLILIATILWLGEVKLQNICLFTIIFIVYRSGKLQEMRVALKVARSGDSGDPSSSCDLLEVETLEHVSDSEI